MSKLTLSKPIVVILYGVPGSGKTYFARNFCNNITAAHVDSDRIRGELFENPRYDKEEDAIINHLMQYMTEEFVDNGVSVVYDVNAMRTSQRRLIRELARKKHANTLLVWFQIDQQTAYIRTTKRDRRKSDDKFARDYDKNVFNEIVSKMQNPTTSEDFIVLSGKHSYEMQQSNVVKKLYDLGLLTAESAASHVTKPGLINLVPGRVDMSRRNIKIR